MAALEAMINGIPVVASDRGGLPEVLGGSGVILPLPDRLTASTRTLPTPEEVSPWVEAVIRFWDDPVVYEEHRRRAFAEAEKRRPEAVVPQYVRFFEGLRPGKPPLGFGKAVRTAWAILLPSGHEVPNGGDLASKVFEDEGVRIFRATTSGGLDKALNMLLSDALRSGFKRFLIINPELYFELFDALRALAKPDPVVIGVQFDRQPHGTRALSRAGTDFLRLRAEVLEQMIASYKLPLIDEGYGKSYWPFFERSSVLSDEGQPLDLGPEATFSLRLTRLGITPAVETLLKVQHPTRDDTIRSALQAE